MNPQEEIGGQCPYCGEPISLLIDCSEPQQVYIEDCEVCCQPITVSIKLAPNGWPHVQLFHENE